MKKLNGLSPHRSAIQDIYPFKSTNVTSIGLGTVLGANSIAGGTSGARSYIPM